MKADVPTNYRGTIEDYRDAIEDALVAEAPVRRLTPLERHVVDTSKRKELAPVGGWVKRCFDVGLALLLIVLTLPLLMMIAVMVWRQDGGGPLFGHERYGFGGKRFFCLKFRSMVVDSAKILEAHLAAHPEAALEWGRNQKLREDPRVTPIGLLLRATSLDELPQLFNVLRGDMSFVGPRPIVAGEIARYGSGFADYSRCRPGITGAWQVGGRSDCSYSERVAFDVAYARRWTVLGDLSILLRTVPVVISRKGSC